MLENGKKEELVAKYQDRYGASNFTGNGGIFLQRARRQMIGLEYKRKSERDYWLDRRKNVKNAMHDLELFIETGGNSVVQAINRETMKPVFDRYFKDPISGMREYYDEKYGGEHLDFLELPSIKKAELAKYLIKVSIDYLGFQQSDSINESSQRTLNEAYDLVCFLVEMFRPEGKRRYHRDYQELRDREESRM